MPFDYIIVGCGMFGAVFARVVAEKDRRVMLIEKRPHIGGNCYSEAMEGIHVHRYGPHVFHTHSMQVWQFVNRFAEFNHFRLRTPVNFGGRLFSFPINLMTLHQLWGVASPAEAERKLASVRVPCENPRNLEDWILAQVGPEIYETFIRGYTTKQWGREPKELPASIIRRLPIRRTYNDRYFDDPYEGIPVGGYTKLFENMLDHDNIRVETGVDFFENRQWVQQQAPTLVYTGKIDEFFDYRFGRLEYRSLRFEHRVLDGDFQGSAIVNYTAADVPHTRITEHKHFDLLDSARTVITYEYPDKYDESKIPYYPVRDQQNTARYEQYRTLGAATKIIFGGRLGTYMYYDMHQVVAQALALADKELEQEQRAQAA
ncbi:MAG: UDP-galactopyranose mutase [Pirellulales bacterium]|nr:UDP-galactopyranose mutase [Pirellulales bacterium]